MGTCYLTIFWNLTFFFFFSIHKVSKTMYTRFFHRLIIPTRAFEDELFNYSFIFYWRKPPILQQKKVSRIKKTSLWNDDLFIVLRNTTVILYNSIHFFWSSYYYIENHAKYNRDRIKISSWSVEFIKYNNMENIIILKILNYIRGVVIHSKTRNWKPAIVQHTWLHNYLQR